MATSRVNGHLLLSNEQESSDVTVTTWGTGRSVYVGVRDGDEELEVAISEDDARSLLEFLKDHLGE